MENKVLKYGNKLEGVLRRYLNCGYHEFGVKSNDNLTMKDWRSPINFALGYRYAQSNNDEDVKKEIEYFLGDVLIGNSIDDVIKQLNYWGFKDEDEAYDHIENIINKLEQILKK